MVPLLLLGLGLCASTALLDGSFAREKEEANVDGVEVKDHQSSLRVSENAAINPLPSPVVVVECESSHEMW